MPYYICRVTCLCASLTSLDGFKCSGVPCCKVCAQILYSFDSEFVNQRMIVLSLLHKYSIAGIALCPHSFMPCFLTLP